MRICPVRLELIDSYNNTLKIKRVQYFVRSHHCLRRNIRIGFYKANDVLNIFSIVRAGDALGSQVS